MRLPSPRLQRTVALGAALLLGCGGAEPPTTPTPPSVDALLLEFDTIDGTLDADAARALVEDALADVATLAVIGALMAELNDAAAVLDESTEQAQGLTATDRTTHEMPQGLTQASQGADPTAPLVGERAQALNAQAGAWARLTHICPGADPSVVDAVNGRIRLRTVLDVLTIAQDGLDRVVVWGEASKCLLATADGVHSLDADITGAMALAEGNDLLLSLVGALTQSTGELADFDLRLRQVGARYELLRTVEGNGSFLIGVSQLDDGLTEAVLTDAEGAWQCTFDAEAETGRCARGGEVFSWP